MFRNGIRIFIFFKFNKLIPALLFFSFFFTNYTIYAQCTHSIDLTDTYGDGWNGGAVTVYVNGTPVLTGITLASGYGPSTFTFSAATGATINVTRTTDGSWPSEMRVYVYRGAVSIIATQQPLPAPGTNGTGSCPVLLPGENCGNAQDLATLTSPYSATTVGYADDISTCRTGYPDRVFFINVPNGYSIDIWESTNGYDEWEYMGYGASCPGTTTINCWDNDGLSHNTWTNNTGSTQTVWYIQDAYSGSGTFTLNWTLTAPVLPGENCTNAQNLATLTSPYSGTTVGYADDIATCRSGYPDRIFYIDVPNGSTIDIWESTNGYDEWEYMGYGSTCPGTTTINCWDNDGLAHNTWTNNTGSTQTVWYIQDAYSGSGTFTLNWNLSTPSDPCATATTISGCGAGFAQTYSSTGTGYWNTSFCGYSVPGTEKVYRFVAPTTGTYSIQVTSAGSWVDYAWQASTCASGGWNCIADIISTGVYGSMSWTAGTTYYILLDDEDATAGSHTFYINCPSGCTPPSITTQPANSGFCPGGSTTFTCIGGPSPTSYQWQYYDGGWVNVSNGNPTGSVYTNPTASVMTISGISVPGAYEYRCVVGNGCTPAAESNTGILTVYTLSSAPSSASVSITPVCSGAATTLSVSGGSLGYSAAWTWYSGSCGGSLVGTGASLVVNPTAATTYYVRAVGTCNSTTCVSTSVTIKAASVAPTGITASSNPICSGNSTTLSVTGGSLGTGASWTWYSGSCGGVFIGTGTSISVSPTANTTYYVRAEGDCNNTACANLTITISSLSADPVSATASVNPVCSGGLTTLSVSGGSLGTGASWRWYSGSCGGTSIGTGTSVNVNPTVATTYYVRAEGTCNTTSCVSVTVNISSNSTAPTSASANPTSIVSGGFSTLTVSGGSLGTGANWTWHSGSCAGAVVGTGSSINVYPAVTTTYYVNAIGTCNTTTCVSVTVTVAAGQVGVINNGAIIYFKGVAGSHAYMYIDGGANGNFYNYINGAFQGKIYTERFEQYGCYIKLEGNWNNYVDNGVFQQGAAPTTHDFNTTEFLGNTSQSIGGNYKTNFYNLTINNSASTVTMNVNAQAGGITTKTGVFSLLNGPFNINGNLITVTNSLVGAITRNAGYIQSTTLDQAFNSRIQWNIGTTTGAHVFPFGTATAYIPFTFNPAAGTNCGDVTLSTYPTGGATAIDVYNNKPTIVTNLNGIYTGTTPPANAANIVRRFWSISPTVNPVTGGSVTLTFTYGNEEPLNGEDPNNMVAQRYDVPLNSWQPPLAGQTSNTTSNTVVVPGVTQMSPWTISRMTQPLPVELTEFSVSCHNNRSELLWITASETNCDRFEIERSENYSYWEHIATINGSGYSTTPLAYQYADLIPYSGTSYYRLRQVDFDGNYSLYGPVSTYCGDLNNNEFDIISISVNSQQKEITVSYKSPDQENEIHIAMFNTVGQEIIRRKEASVAGNGVLVFSSDYLTTGIYLLNIESSQKKFTQKIVIF